MQSSFCILNTVESSQQHKNYRHVIKQRFGKYKSINSQPRSQMLLTDEDIDSIFSTFIFNSILPNYSLKESFGSIATNDCLQNQLSSNEGESVKTIDSFNDQNQSSIIKKSQFIFKNQCCQSKPIYIRQFSRLNAILPNYHHPLFNIKKQMQNLISLIKEALNAIKFVFSIVLQLDNNIEQIKLFQQNQLTIEHFMLSNWQNNKYSHQLALIKPYQNFKAIKSFGETIEELNLLLSKIERYKLVISLTQSLERRLYLSIRQNLFQIQQKLIDCSNFIYAQVNSKSYPDFYYNYFQVLSSKKQYMSSEKVEQMKQQFIKLQYLQKPLTCSEVGRMVWDKLLEYSDYF